MLLALTFVILSQSMAYIITPLWLTPFFILRTPKSDKLALILFLKVERLFEVVSVVKFIISKTGTVALFIGLAVFAYLSWNYLETNPFPDGWINLILRSILGAIGAGIITGLVLFATIPTVILGYVLLLVLTSISIRILAVIHTLFTALPYTFSRTLINYRNIILKDNLKDKIELVPRIHLVRPQYSTSAFKNNIENSTEHIISGFHDKDHRIQMLVELLGLLFYGGCLACLVLPSLLPRICVKISSLPLAAILLIPRKVLLELRGMEFINKIADDINSALFALFLILLQAFVFAVAQFNLLEKITEWERLGVLQNFVVDVLYSEANFDLTLLTAALTLISYFLAKIVVWRSPNQMYVRYTEHVLRALGVSRVLSSISIVLLILTTDKLKDLLTGFLPTIIG